MEFFMSLYFVAIEPQAALFQKIKGIQRDFSKRFQAEKAYRNFPHITIVPPFMHDEKNESEVVGHFLKATPLSSPFTVKLNGYGSFDHKKHPVIFIKPEASEALNEIYRVFARFMDCFQFVRNFHPHVTVAYRDLSYENYDKAWKEYAALSFNENFEVSRIGLYKHYEQKWNLLATKELKKS